MTEQRYAAEAEALREQLYRTAYLYLGGASQAVDAVDEAVYKGLRACGKLREERYFSTWLTRILINVCHTELRRRRRLAPLGGLPATGQGALRALEQRENFLPQHRSFLLTPCRAVFSSAAMLKSRERFVLDIIVASGEAPRQGAQL